MEVEGQGRSWIVAALALGLLLASMLAAGRASAAGADTRAAAYAAPKLVDSRGAPLRGPYARWLRGSLMPIVRGPLRVHLTGCPYDANLGGCVFNDRLFDIYLSPRAGRKQRRALLFHELGHLYDFRVMNNRDRDDFRRIFGSRQRWWRGNPSVAEYFAEAYSWCARKRRIRDIGRIAFYHYDPTPQEHRQACALIQRAALPSSAPPQPPPASSQPMTDEPAPAPQHPPARQQPPAEEQPPASEPPPDDGADQPDEDGPPSLLPPALHPPR